MNRAAMVLTLFGGLLSVLGCTPAAPGPVKNAETGRKTIELDAAAPDFELNSIDGIAVKLSELTAKGPVVLVVLRGYPGYQCPVCNQQAGDFLGKAGKFKDAGANVVFIYPGPSDALVEKAQEFAAGKTLPTHFQLAVDPDYKFTQAYGLRWAAAGETAYPAAYLIDTTGKIRFAKVSRSHGERAEAAAVLDALAKLNS
jgi:peroxiredoxin